TPRFEATDPDAPAPTLPYPLFVKPVKGTMSIRARRVEGESDLREAVRFSLRDRLRLFLLLRPYQQLLRHYGDGEIPAHFFIAEEPLTGEQVTVDGFVQNRRATAMGVVDSVMFPGTMSFQRFEYPSRHPPDVVERMKAIAVRAI